MYVHLHTKFKVSSKVLTSFRQGGGNFIPLPTSKQTPKKPT